jgi:hypothetical protein
MPPKSYYYENATDLAKLQADFAKLSSHVPVKLGEGLRPKEEQVGVVEDDDTIGEREAYMIANYGPRGYLATPENYKKYLAYKQKNSPNGWGIVTDAITHAAGTMLGGAWSMIKTGDIASPHTLAGTAIEGAWTGTRYFTNMLDIIKYDASSPIHRALFSQGTDEQQYLDYISLMEFQKEMKHNEENGRWIPPEFSIGDWKLKGFNKEGVAGLSMVADPTVIFPPMKIGGAIMRGLSKTALAIEVGSKFSNILAHGSIAAEKQALKFEAMAGKVAGVGEGAYNYVGNKIENIFGIENITTSNGKIVPKEQIMRTAQGALMGTALVKMPYVGAAAGMWATAKVTELGSRTIAEALALARQPSYLTIAERLAYQSESKGVQTIGKIANFSNGFFDYLGGMSKASFHGSMYGAAFGYGLGGEEGFYHGVGTGIGLGGSMHMLGSVYGLYGNRTQKQINNVLKHFAYVSEGFDAPKKEGINVLLENTKKQFGEEAMYRVMAGIAASERLQKNSTHLVLTTEKIKELMSDADWQEYQKELGSGNFGGYTTRKKDGRIYTIINADYAAPTAVSGELFHNALLNDRYGTLLKEHVTKGFLGTTDSDGFLYKMPVEARVSLLEKFRNAYMELDDTSPQVGSQRSMLKDFNDAIEMVKSGQKPETLYPIFEELAESYFGKYVQSKPIDYLLRGDSPLNNFGDIVWNSALDSVHRLMRHDIEQAGGRIQFKSGDPEGFFLDAKGKRVVVPELDRVMKIVVDKMRRDKDTVRGFPSRVTEGLADHEITFKGLDHLYKKDVNGRFIPKTEEEYNTEQEGRFTNLIAGLSKLKPEEKGLSLVEVKTKEEAAYSGSYAARSRRGSLESTKAEITKANKEYEKNQRKLERDAQRTAKRLEKNKKDSAEITDEVDGDTIGSIEEGAELAQYEGPKQFKIKGMMTKAEYELFEDAFGSTIANRLMALTETAYKAGIDGNNLLQFTYESAQTQKFSHTLKGSPTGEDNTRYAGTVKERHVIPYEVILSYERKRLTKKDREKLGIDDPDIYWKVGKPKLMVNGIDYYAIDRRVNYMFNHMRPTDDVRSIGNGYIKAVYSSEAEIHYDVKRLLSNYSRGDIAMAGAEFFGGGKIGRAKRDIINAVIGAHPPKEGFDASYMQRKGYNYPLHAQLRNSQMNEAFTPWTSFRLDRISGKIRHMHGEGFFYSHDHAYEKAQGNFNPRQRLPEPRVRDDSYSRTGDRVDSELQWHEPISEGYMTTRRLVRQNEQFGGITSDRVSEVDVRDLIYKKTEFRDYPRSMSSRRAAFAYPHQASWQISLRDPNRTNGFSTEPQAFGLAVGQMRSFASAVDTGWLNLQGIPQQYRDAFRVGSIGGVDVQSPYRGLGGSDLLYAEAFEHLYRRGVGFVKSTIINDMAIPIHQRIKMLGNENVHMNMNTSYGSPDWVLADVKDAKRFIRTHGQIEVLAGIVPPKGGFQPRQRKNRDHLAFEMTKADSEFTDRSWFKSKTGEPFRMYVAKHPSGTMFAYFDESHALEAFGEATAGYLSHEHGFIIDHSRVERPITFESMTHVLDIGWGPEQGKQYAYIFRDENGNKAVSFHDTKFFKQADGNNFDEGIFGVFAPRQTKKPVLTAREQIEQKAKELKLKTDEANRLRKEVSEERVMLLRRIAAEEKKSLRPKNTNEEEMARRRQLRLSLQLLDEVEASSSVMKSVFKGRPLELVKNKKASMAVIASLSDPEYAKYRASGELPPDIVQRHLDMVDAALMDHWKRKHALRKRAVDRKEQFEKSAAGREQMQSRYESELKALEEELITALTAYEVYDVAENILGAVEAKTRYRLSDGTEAQLTATEARQRGAEEVVEKRQSGRELKKNYDMLDAAYSAVSQLKGTAGMKGSTERLVVMMQAISKQLELAAKTDPAAKARLNEVTASFTRTYNQTNTNLRAAAADILKHGLHSLNWKESHEYTTYDKLGRVEAQGPLVRAELPTSGHYIKAYEPPANPIGLNFNKIKLPSSMSFQPVTVEITGRGAGDKFVGEYGVRTAIEGLRKELAQKTKMDFSEWTDQNIADLALATPKQVEQLWGDANNIRPDKIWQWLQPNSSPHAKKIREWAKGENKVSTKGKNGQILMANGKPAYVMFVDNIYDSPFEFDPKRSIFTFDKKSMYAGRSAFPSDAKGITVVPASELGVIEGGEGYHFMWDKDRFLRGETQSETFRSFDDMIQNHQGMQTIKRLTFPSTTGKYTVHQPNGNQIGGVFTNVAEAKRLAILDLHQNNSSDIVFQSLKRLDAVAGRSLIDLIEAETDIKYLDPRSVSKVRRAIDNPDYNPNLPQSETNQPKIIETKTEQSSPNSQRDFRDLAVYKFGDMILVTSDSNQSKISAVRRNKKDSKTNTGPLINQIEQTSGGTSFKTLGDVFKIRFRENGEFLSVERVDTFKSTKELRQWMRQMTDPETASFQKIQGVATRLSEQFGEMIKPAFIEERKRVARVLKENPALIREKLKKLQEINKEYLEELKRRKIATTKTGLQEAIKENNIEIDILTEQRDSHLIFLAKRGFLRDKNVQKKIIQSGMFKDVPEILEHEKFLLEYQPRGAGMEHADYQIASGGALPKDAVTDLINNAIRQASVASDKLVRPFGLEDTLNALQEKIKGDDYIRLEREIELLEDQLQAARGGKINNRVMNPLEKIRIGKKRGVVKQMTPEEARKYELQLKIDESKAKEIDTDTALSQYEADVVQNLEPKADYFTLSRYLPIEKWDSMSGRWVMEEYTSPHELHQRFKRSLSDMTDLYRSTMDESNPNRVSLEQLLKDNTKFEKADHELTKKEMADDADLNLRGVDGFDMSHDLTPEGLTFRRAMNTLINDEINIYTQKGNIERKLAVQFPDDVERAKQMEKVWAKIEANYNKTHQKNKEALLDAYMKMPKELQAKYEEAYITRQNENMLIIQTRLKHETAEFVKAVKERLVTINAEDAEALQKYQEMGIKDDPNKVFPSNHPLRYVLPHLFEEIYPLPQDLKAASSMPSPIDAQTNTRVPSATKNVPLYEQRTQRADGTFSDVVPKTSESDVTGVVGGERVSGWRYGETHGAETGVNLTLKSVIENENIDVGIRRQRGLRQIDMFARAYAHAKRMKAEQAKGGEARVDAEDMKLVSMFFPEMFSEGHPDFVQTKPSVRQEYIAGVKEMEPTFDQQYNIHEMNTLFHHWVKATMADQNKTKNAIARLSGEERLAELTRPENLDQYGNIDWNKLTIEEMDFVIHSFERVNIGLGNYKSLSDFINNPLYEKAMLSTFFNAQTETLRTIFDNPRDAAVFLSLKGEEKVKFLHQMIGQIKEQGRQVEFDVRREARQPYLEATAGDWMAQIELARTAEVEDKVRRVQQTYIDLAKTESALKVYRGRTEQFMKSRPDALQNVLDIDDGFKLLSPDPATSVQWTDMGFPLVVNPNPNDTFFRTPNGMFVAFRDGKSYKLFFNGHTSEDGNLKVNPSHVMTAPDLDRIQVAIRFFADDLKKAALITKEMAGSEVLPADKLGTFTKSFFDRHGGTIPPDVITNLTESLSKIGVYADTTFIQVGNNKRKVILYPESDAWDRIHSGDYEKVNGSWRIRKEVAEARLELFAAKERNRNMPTVEPKAVEEVGGSANMPDHLTPPPPDKAASKADAKTTFTVRSEGPIMMGESNTPVYNDWTTVTNDEGFTIIRQQALDAKAWRSTFLVFSPNGIQISKTKSEQEAVTAIFEYNGR